MTKMADLAIMMEEAFALNKTFSFPVSGTSMTPFLKPGDVVEMAKPDNCRKSDIVLFKRLDGAFVLHRIRKVKKDYYVFLGDNQTNDEFPIYANQLIGKVISYQRQNEEKIRKLKGIRYNLFLLIWHFKIIRKVYHRLKR